MAFISSDNKFCFINIPRTGAGSVNSLLSNKISLIETIPQKTTISSTFISNPEINQCYKFSYVRNPYDWVASLYYSMQNDRHPDFIYIRKLNFNQFIDWLYSIGMKRLESAIEPFYRTQTDYLFHKGKLAVNMVYKFEGLCNDTEQSNINTLLLKLEFPMVSVVPFLNKSSRPFLYEEIYDDKAYRSINKIFYNDFKNFKYQINER